MPRSQEKLDVAARAAWLYYVAGRTQHEIAEALAVSRPVVQRLIALAVEKNLVRVRVEHRVADCLSLAAALSERFGLALCEVVPFDDDSEDDLKKKLAVASADMFERFLGSETPIVVSVSSGRTLKSAVAELSPLERVQHRLVSMVGTIAQDGSSNPYDVATLISERLGCKRFLMPAPLMADNEEESRQWCNHRLYQVVERLSAAADVSFVGIGDIGPDCPQEADGFITRAEVLDLMARGAVGELLGRSIDAEGRIVDAPCQRRLTSITLHVPPRMPTIGFAGGAAKHRAVAAVLRGGWLTGLVTDERCARAVLEQGSAAVAF
ncbi:sugar-binding transcriptional regulator [Robbsia sp. Bb-Pol-6]|uniref:Sugar-binding transcriptional regulator n=1 Tax=Robbsia betulipollinis TaxID=2981849 RepID=A0ABT3ZQA4_9BURK|nr:sugar-binding transcriptional regulator [Robbsia betulipollinis]